MAEHRHVAFLRAINVGNRRVTNDELAAAFTQSGMADVETYQAAGNVIFTTEDTEPPRAQIEEGLEKVLGYEVPIFARTAAEATAIAARELFTVEQLDASTGKEQVAFFEQPPDNDRREKTLELATDTDLLAFGERELHWLPAGGFRDSQLDLDAVEELCGLHTVRTKGTVERIARKYFGA
ncbi:MAG: DUF1697 domain-containing protein [Solirubrobacterales bacterium]